MLLDKDCSSTVRLKYMKHYLPAERRGFTLIELLVVIGILAVLLAITLIAINPAHQFALANDTKRRSDVNAILNAVGQYMADNHGTLPTGIPSGTAAEISDSGANICSSLISTYLAALPTDPKSATNGAPVTSCAGTYSTGYSIVQSATDNRITVSAVGEITPVITVTR